MGDAVLHPPSVSCVWTRRLIEHVAPTLPGAAEPSELDRLTDREREILIEVASGDSNAEIAERLHVSEATVKTHVGRLLHKLGTRDRVQLAVLAYETRLVVPGT